MPGNNRACTATYIATDTLRPVPPNIKNARPAPYNSSRHHEDTHRHTPCTLYKSADWPVWVLPPFSECLLEIFQSGKRDDNSSDSISDRDVNLLISVLPVQFPKPRIISEYIAARQLQILF